MDNETMQNEQLQDEQQHGERQQQDDYAKRERKSFILGVVTGALIIALCGAVTFLITSLRHSGKSNAIKVTASKGEEKTIVNESSISKLQALEETIETYYLDEVDTQTLLDGMYSGLLGSLKDPYSVYYTAEQLTELYEKTQGVYYGIGAYVSIDNDLKYPYISKLIEGTPAAASELQPDDLIYEVEGESTYGMDLSSVVSMIKGAEGTEVHITAARNSGAGYDYIDVTIVRAKINSPTVSYEMFDNGIAHIEIVEFDDVTTDQFIEALAMAKGSDMKGLILDLRGNPGGNLSTVVEIAGQFLPKGDLIVYTEDKYGNRENYYSQSDSTIDVPLIVLVDANSASASEILAGAIKDYGIGTLVGTTTFGKGIVQRIMTLTDGSAIKLTISKYYTPNGYNIHKIGIDPDVEVPFDNQAYREDRSDNQLEEALRMMEEMIEEQGE